MKNPTVLLVAGHSVVRLGLRMLLAARPSRIIAEAANAAQAELLAEELQPEIVVLDMSLSDAHGITALERITRTVPAARILFISERDDEEFVERALVSGASAYLLRETATADLKWAVQAAEKGREYFSPALIKRLRGPEARIPEPEQVAVDEYEANQLETRLAGFLNQGLVIRHLAQELRAGLASLNRSNRVVEKRRTKRSRPRQWNLGKALVALFRGGRAAGQVG